MAELLRSDILIFIKEGFMLFYIIGGIVFLLTAGYFFLMFFYPEWVGMSGEVTEKAIQEHKSDEDEDEHKNLKD